MSGRVQKGFDRSGEKYGKWLVLAKSPSSSWFCRCECGREKVVSGSSLISGKSTGCASCHSKKHGMEGTRVYNIWAGMKQRCQNPKYHCYKLYGGRGIKVCDRWQNFEDFFADMGQPPEKMSLGRIDNDGDYEPLNCRWESQKQQIRNRSNTKLVTIDRVTLSLAEFAELQGVPYRIMKQRIRNGIDLKLPYRSRK